MSAANITLAILAGGEGSRMGKVKALLNIDGVPILRRILSQANWPGPTMLVTSPGKQHPPGSEGFDQEVTDPAPGLGPIRGLLTALENAPTNSVIILPVDMPAIGHEPLAWLAARLSENPDAIGIMLERTIDTTKTLEPLPAAFHRSVLNEIAERFAQGQTSLRNLAEHPRMRIIPAPPWPAEVWINLNHPEDLARFEMTLKQRL